MNNGWNHNIHCHRFVLDAMPPNCRLALDIGCGRGELAHKLAGRAAQVIAIDADEPILSQAMKNADSARRIEFVPGDVLRHPFPLESFDFITAVATLHHLPLNEAQIRFGELLKPGGVLAIIGLYRLHSIIDYAFGAAAMPISRTRCLILGTPETGAPLCEPAESLREIREACISQMPAGDFRRRFFFRYTFVWHKPSPDPTSDCD